MATYYRWRRNTISYVEQSMGSYSSISAVRIYGSGYVPTFVSSSGTFRLSRNPEQIALSTGDERSYGYESIVLNNSTEQTEYYRTNSTTTEIGRPSSSYYTFSPSLTLIKAVASAGTFQQYVYSTNASAYPNGGVSGSYYYDQRTTITSPTAPTGLTYPNPITTPTVTVSWGAATSNMPSYSVSSYEVSYSTNGGSSWTVAGTTAETNYNFSVTPGTASIMFRVRAKDSNGQWGAYITGTASDVFLAPTLTVPSLAMQSQPITVNWTAIEGATSYTLQRKANTDADWVDVYSGSALTFTETVGAWTSVQYQVQAVFSSGAGGLATSASIPVVSASALVISGTDEDLGTLTEDVAYTVSSDTGNPITLTRTVNGNLVATLTVQSGFAYTIPVMDLPTGSGTIEISATVNTTSGGPVSATRTWTYQKTAITFPNGASVGQLNQNGANVFPATLAEAVKVPANWGGTLDKALELLYDAANSAVISVGTYEGSGTFGADNPNTLTISPAPQVVTIYGGGQTLVISSTDTSSPAYINGTTVKWYSTVSAADQMNTDGVTYSYVAVAKGVTT